MCLDGFIYVSITCVCMCIHGRRHPPLAPGMSMGGWVHLMDQGMDAWMDGWMDGWVDAFDGWMDVKDCVAHICPCPSKPYNNPPPHTQTRKHNRARSTGSTRPSPRARSSEAPRAKAKRKQATKDCHSQRACRRVVVAVRPLSPSSFLRPCRRCCCCCCCCSSSSSVVASSVGGCGGPAGWVRVLVADAGARSTNKRT